MIDWDRHEIDTRNKLLEILRIYRVQGELFGIPEKELKGLSIYSEPSLSAITDEIYQIIKEELKKNVRPDSIN